jgi:PHD/YefM family antitoxin component YafN of YafNO toxin-antitoxin module
MTTLPLSDAKSRLPEIADEVRRTHDRVHITKNPPPRRLPLSGARPGRKCRWGRLASAA